MSGQVFRQTSALRGSAYTALASLAKIIDNIEEIIDIEYITDVDNMLQQECEYDIMSKG